MRSWARWALAAGAVLVFAAAAVAVRLTVAPSPRTARFEVPREDIAIPVDATAIARGKHLSEAVAVCTVCHGDNLAGRLAFEHPLLGRGFTPNLTAGHGGIGGVYTVSDWARAVRHGVDRNGRGLLFMPVDHYRHLTDADLGAMIAYFRSVPAVDNDSPGLQLSALARLMIDLGLSGEVVRAARIDHFAATPPPPASAGEYLVRIAGCTFCHGDRLAGGRGLEPGAPPAPDLTPAGPWGRRDFAAFAAVMRSGIAPDGHAIDPRFMPWQGYRQMTDAELRSIWDHLARQVAR